LMPRASTDDFTISSNARWSASVNSAGSTVKKTERLLGSPLLRPETCDGRGTQLNTTRGTQWGTK
jgi:hypothetical protein